VKRIPYVPILKITRCVNNAQGAGTNQGGKKGAPDMRDD